MNTPKDAAKSLDNNLRWSSGYQRPKISLNTSNKENVSLNSSKNSSSNSTEGNRTRKHTLEPLDMDAILREMNEEESLPMVQKVPEKPKTEAVEIKLNVEEVDGSNKIDKLSDSFDFDFAKLSLTPNKKPLKINVKLNPILEDQSKEEHIFLSPRVKQRIQQPPNWKQINTPNIQKKTVVNTPKDKLFHGQKFITPSSKAFSLNRKPPVAQDNSKVIQSKQKQTIIVKEIEYVAQHLLGKGGSSEVFQCYNAETKDFCAIKCVSLANPESANGYINEVKILEKLQKCDKIIKMIDFEIITAQKKLFVVLEKGGRDLSTILKQLALKKSHISMHMLLFYWMEMLYAVQQIHENGIIHTDLKPANFLEAGQGLKLIDFGIATCMESDVTSVFKSNAEGSFNYISPEAINGNTSNNYNSPSYGKNKYKLNFKSDVWSLGCILYQLVYRRTPFQHITQLATRLSTLLNPNHKIEYPEANWVSPKIIDTIKRCLQFDNKLRPSVNDLIKEYESSLYNLK